MWSDENRTCSNGIALRDLSALTDDEYSIVESLDLPTRKDGSRSATSSRAFCTSFRPAVCRGRQPAACHHAESSTVILPARMTTGRRVAPITHLACNAEEPAEPKVDPTTAVIERHRA
jgi:hypothetical protein